jgi:hypothetical protein
MALDRVHVGRATAGGGGILALDLGTSTGWAIRSPDGIVTSGAVSFKPGRFVGGGMRAPK